MSLWSCLKTATSSLCYAILCVLVLGIFMSLGAVELPGAPGRWPAVLADPPCCNPTGPYPGDKVFNEMLALDYPFHGYPLRSVLFKGLHDTFRVSIGFNNYSGQDFSLTSSSPETWFKPRVFQIGDHAESGTPFLDSLQLGFRIRGWYYGVGKKVPPPTKLPAERKWGDADNLIMEVWNLPAGNYCLCIDTTKEVPSNFVGRPNSFLYDLRAPESVADSFNAYENLFWRAYWDSLKTEAKTWLDLMLVVNPSSVPGWWCRADYFWYFDRDTVAVRTSLDKALEFLANGADPAMPDEIQQRAHEECADYVTWIQWQIEGWRQRLGD